MYTRNQLCQALERWKTFKYSDVLKKKRIHVRRSCKKAEDSDLQPKSRFIRSLDGSPTVCSKCPSGRYSNSLATSCLDCARGRFSAEQGQANSCLPCPAGTFSESFGKSFCLACVEGKFTENSGASVCLDCPRNSTTLQIQSSGVQSCICPSGAFGMIFSEYGCRTCRKYRGIRCDANSSIPFVEGGFWRDPNEVSLAFECIPKSSCLESGFSGNTLCSEGYRGKQCGEMRWKPLSALWRMRFMP